MALSTYLELRNSIATWLQRDDLTAVIPDFIALAESDIMAQLSDCACLQSRGTATTVAGNALVDVPGMVRLVDAWLDSDHINIAPHNSIPPNAGISGRPTSVCVEGNDQLRFHPTPDGAYSVDVLYLPVMSPSLAGGEPADAATNWILQQHPSMYLYGSLLAASAFIQDDGRIMQWQQGYEDAMRKFRGVTRGGNVMLETGINEAMQRNAWSIRNG